VVVPPDDMQQAADALADLLANPDELTRLTTGAKETDLASWEAQNMCLKIASIYASYLAKKDIPW
jgi:hypothetical protein